MNCVNHPEAAVTAFCQNCGKGLCTQCSREVQGNVFCEPCLAARVTGAAAPGAPSAYQPGYAPPPVGAPNPGTATILGFIPGVGAMYNGQYIKAIVHVLVFVVLISITEHYGMFGIFVGAWVLYQVFDAHQTAKARRDGLPLPDPFGLNELGNAFGGHTPRPYTPPPVPPAGTPPGAAPGAAPGNPPQYADWAEQVRQQAHQFGQQSAEWGEQLRQRIVAETTQAARPFNPGGPGTWGTPPPPAAGFAPGTVPPPPGWTAPPGVAPPMPPYPPIPPQMELDRARREPIGAIVLILLGMLFLFNTLGFFNFGWVSHGWPLIIVGIAVWLLARNSGRFRYGAPGGPPPPVGPSPQQANAPQPVGTSQEPPAGGGQ
ncbi:MAG: B-box zinc finger protein [Acidobacteriaceae bacterium]